VDELPMSRAVVTAATAPLRGELRLPGDKSISHRRALLSLYVDGRVRLSRYAAGDDARTTLACVQKLGKRVTRCGDEVTIEGPAGCESGELDCGNSGTTARLLLGILAGHDGEWILHGDASLSRRPMERVAEPLRQMGAQITLHHGCLPAHIVGQPLTAVSMNAPAPSAQVKTAVLLAALRAQRITRYRETIPTRDHTERLLGLRVDWDGTLAVNPAAVTLSAESLSAEIPVDPSSAAFWAAAGLLVPGSQLVLPGLLANSQRIHYVDLLQEAGAPLALGEGLVQAGEEVATLRIEAGRMQPFEMTTVTAAQLIDEIPILAVLAASLAGRSVFQDVGELRVKESDRLWLTVNNLRRMGAEVEEWADGFAVTGRGPLQGAEIETAGDHRIAMAFGIAGLAAQGKTILDDAACVAVSYPGFWGDLGRLSPGSVTFEA
jgi:3-phosphoshikimate 1-carboxyvinyltransferase